MTEKNRIMNHPILGILEDKKRITFMFDGQLVDAYEGDTIAAALLANNIRTLRYHEETATPRGIYCNIGHCFECRLSVNGRNGVRSCITVVEEGMKVEASRTLPSPLKEVESK
ncbi:(2Fe-2S)-binding protein [Cytobacillus sp. IB215665]|uniref:(2Fe-2S)-binding protein n=1 Tax=Cytobacillus sp. IB215665 TaxID=3097357 RepID=UPI002A12A689|nr:(2Fe-2S)-binding protein [Cytobacillus sp. IB215665]MDX8366431.1 (2Fe-2S)-binding protein [Cytobacillus sp. IB215665]